MPKYETRIKATFYVCCVFLYVLTRHFGILTNNPTSLISTIIESWSTSLPFAISNWFYDHVFDIFDEPLANAVTHWINERSYPNGLMHFFGLFGSEYIVPTDQDGLVEVHSTHSYDYEKSCAFRRYANRVFGDNLVSQEQAVHKTNWKTFLPASNQTNIHVIHPLLTAKSRQFNEYISSLLNKVPESDLQLESRKATVVCITDAIFRATMDTASIVALGIDLETMKGKNIPLFKAMKMLFTSNRQKKKRFILHNLLPPWLDRLIPSDAEGEMDTAKSVLFTGIRSIVEIRMAETDRKYDHLTYLSIVSQLGTLEKTEYIGQINAIFAAGFESSGGSLSFVIYCLAANQDAQQLVRKEVLQSKGENVTLDEDESDRLPVLNAMVMESLRLFPSFGFLLRKAIRDTTIKGHHIPRGTNIAVCPKAINSALHIWGDDAEKLNLERWIDRSNPENPKQVPTGGAPSTICMLSFGYGTRSCVGRHLAMAQIKRQIALIVERFHVETEDDKFPHPSGLFATTPPPDFRLRFTELN
ncbi:cytochrome P450 [Aspergillus eucalypticola CBS 122712]|uniref:Cytochrome P450 n=1 Tax=Aspergillus eucalypticola (strain CBS 122712 / IBT 29274) TaxID=1448314 RepID=A0A317UIQ2_ASPEC|nr:cytochrome P450 [Aspergillus eucalypticola CBS 122712]PWY61964.1 cytochrome P450 [Aspergillus eucalypticola CBS 122712]